MTDLVEIREGKIGIVNRNTGEFGCLSVNEIYQFLFSKKGDEAHEISRDLETLSFRKIPLKATLKLHIDNEKILSKVYLTNYRDIFTFDLNTFIRTSELNYILLDNILYPIDESERNRLLDISNELSSADVLYKLSNILDSNADIIEVSWSAVEYKQFIIKKIKDESSTLFERDLYKYQRDGLKWLKYCCLRGTGTILGDDMGLGKTAQIIAFIAWFIEVKKDKGVLIVVPSTLLENWRREFEFFAPKIKPLIHHGNDRTGSFNNLKEYDVVITSYSMIINDFYLFNKLTWNLIITDEASLLKNAESERRKYLSKLERRVFVAMTGTPIENSLLDLWSIADLVSPGIFGRNEDFSKKYIKRSIEHTLMESDLDSIKKKIEPFIIRRTKEEVLDSLPKRIDIHQALEMSNAEQDEYKKVREEIISQSDGKSFSEIFILIQKLRQFTTHPFLLNKEKLEFKANLKGFLSNSTKLRRTFEILNEIKLSNEKVLIFTEYLDMIDFFKEAIRDHFSAPTFTIDGRIEVNQRQENIDLFSACDGFAVMILNPKTAGMGLNITEANHVIHYTRQWNPALEEQASARSYRNKQTKPVNIYYLYYVESIEEYIDKRLRQKSMLSSEIITINNQELTLEDLMSSLQLTP